MPTSPQRILSIQSHVVDGHAGNQAAVFPLQRLGFEVSPIHTVQFSNHTGHQHWTGQVFTPQHIRDLIAGLNQRQVLGQYSAVLSGYMGSAAIGQSILEAVRLVKRHNPSALYCCDPVMGDTGCGLFVRADIPEWFRTQMLPMADIITPNLFELEILSQRTLTTLSEVQSACQWLHTLGPAVIVVTSLILPETPTGQIQMLVSHSTNAWLVSAPRFTFSTPPGGAGDVTAALFLGRYLQTHSLPESLTHTASALLGVFQITRNLHSAELQLIAAQEELVHPSVRCESVVIPRLDRGIHG